MKRPVGIAVGFACVLYLHLLHQCDSLTHFLTFARRLYSFWFLLWWPFCAPLVALPRDKRGRRKHNEGNIPVGEVPIDWLPVEALPSNVQCLHPFLDSIFHRCLHKPSCTYYYALVLFLWCAAVLVWRHLCPQAHRKRLSALSITM